MVPPGIEIGGASGVPGPSGGISGVPGPSGGTSGGFGPSGGLSGLPGFSRFTPLLPPHLRLIIRGIRKYTVAGRLSR